MSLPCLSSVFSFFYCEFVPFVILSSWLHGDVNKINMEKNVVVLNSEDCEFQLLQFCSIFDSLNDITDFTPIMNFRTTKNRESVK